MIPYNPPIIFNQPGSWSPHVCFEVEGMEEDSQHLRLEGAAEGQGQGDLEEDVDHVEEEEVPKVEKPPDQHETLIKNGVI